MRRVLVVDDEPKILRLIGTMLGEAGYGVETCERCDEAKALLAAEIFDLLITDVRLPDATGVELLEHARTLSPGIQVILITAYGTITDAVRAMKLGAFDYIQKPFEMEALRCLAENALNATVLMEELHVLRADALRRRPERSLVAGGNAMAPVLELVNKVAPGPTTVLLTGESGTGKEIVAETIHRLSPVAKRPFIRVNCLAIPSELMESELFGHVRGAFTGAEKARKGWFELADGGSLLLDEIVDLPMTLQGKLLRVLEERLITRVGSGKPIPVDVRLMATTNVDLQTRVKGGTFREDLYYRLNVFPISLPSLRERIDDIPELTRCLLSEIGTIFGRQVPEIEPEVMNALTAYRWPGNVRELRNILERAFVLAAGDPISMDHLPSEIMDGSGDAAAPSGGFTERVEHYKARLLLKTLRKVGWVKKTAAAELGLSPRALSHYIGKYGLENLRKKGAGPG